MIALTTGLLYCIQQSEYETKIYHLSILIMLNLLVLQQSGKMSTLKIGIQELRNLKLAMHFFHLNF